MKNIWKRLFPKKYYWYHVRYEYKKKNGGLVIWQFTAQVGLVKKTSILNFRDVKKSMIPLHKLTVVKRDNLILCNGFLFVEPTCYLGHF